MTGTYPSVVLPAQHVLGRVTRGPAGGPGWLRPNAGSTYERAAGGRAGPARHPPTHRRPCAGTTPGFLRGHLVVHGSALGGEVDDCPCAGTSAGRRWTTGAGARRRRGATASVLWTRLRSGGPRCQCAPYRL